MWVALYTVGIHLARAGLEHEARMRAIRAGAAPFPLPPSRAAADAARVPRTLPYPLRNDGGDDGRAWELLSESQRSDAVKSVVSVTSRSRSHVCVQHTRSLLPYNSPFLASVLGVFVLYRAFLFPPLCCVRV